MLKRGILSILLIGGLLLISGGASAVAQQVTLRTFLAVATVTDCATQQPIEAARVTVLNKSISKLHPKHVLAEGLTDTQGKFSAFVLILIIGNINPLQQAVDGVEVLVEKAGLEVRFSLAFAVSTDISSFIAAHVCMGPASGQAPVAVFVTSPSDPRVGEAVRFDASGSRDTDGEILLYRWDFGDGTTSEGAQVSHAYAAAGTYSVKLEAVDDKGLSKAAVQTVQVAP